MQTLIIYEAGDKVVVTKEYQDYKIGERLKITSWDEHTLFQGGHALIFVDSIDGIPHKYRSLYAYAVEPLANNADEEVQRDPAALYTYYMVDYQGCTDALGEFVLCETLEQVADAIRMADVDLDGPSGSAMVAVRGVGLTPIQYAQYLIDKEDPTELYPLLNSDLLRDAAIDFAKWI